MKFDFVIFGASGFTGQFVVQFLAKAIRSEEAKNPSRRLTWAVAGRSEDKLRAVLEEASTATEINLHDIPIILCDTDDEESVLKMCSQARVLLNCVGPYRFFGERVVSACVQSGTHHLDISGEPQYLESSQLRYHEAAVDKGVYVVGSCGFDSVPSDVGQMFLTKKMGGDVNSIEVFLKVTTPPGVSGPVINYGTWQSLVHGLAKEHELPPLRKKLFPERLPSLKPKLERRSLIHYNELVGSYCLPFPGSDRSVMMRTQRARYENDSRRPAQVGCYFQVSSFCSALLTILAGAVLGIMVKCKCGRNLLEKYPGFFSCGLVSKEGPSKEMAAETNFLMTLVGLGWKDSVSDPKTNHDVAPNRRVTVTVSGKNVGYGSTCECLVQCALVLLLEPEKLPGHGGVLTPGYAFANTTLVERLNMNEVLFSAQVKDV